MARPVTAEEHRRDRRMISGMIWRARLKVLIPLFLAIGFGWWGYRVWSKDHANEVQQPASGSPSGQPVAPYKAVTPTLSKFETRSRDAHICMKPEDAIYQGKPQSGRGQTWSDPKFLFAAKNSDDTITWANGFKGTVPVCFLVDVQGNPQNVTFFQSPGADLEDHIRAIVLAWRYEPGRFKESYNDQDGHPVPVEVAFDFIFP